MTSDNLTSLAQQLQTRATADDDDDDRPTQPLKVALPSLTTLA
jgi:hypothetical protein